VFLATANRADIISAPLLDRMELIQLSGYTLEEKIAIATRHLIPKQVQAAFLTLGQDVAFLPSAVGAIAAGYTREAGVRTLERRIGSICRHGEISYILMYTDKMHSFVSTNMR
jgi:ATP-dependent Lon protease